MITDTGLLDKNKKHIKVGDIVEWDDSEGKRTAKVIFENGSVGFHCFKNSVPNWAIGHVFFIGDFIYADTEKHLTIISKGEKSSSSETEKDKGGDLKPCGSSQLAESNTLTQSGVRSKEISSSHSEISGDLKEGKTGWEW